MRHRRSLFVPGAAVLTLAAVLGWALRGCGARREFSSVADFRSWAASHGWHVWPEGGEPGSVTAGESADVRRVLAAGQVDPREITVQAQHADADLELPPNVAYRVWGRVVVYGSPRLLERLDALR